MLLDCRNACKSYKSHEDVLEAVPVFDLVLADFEINEIISAFKSWIHDKTEFPTPADIKNIIVRKKSFNRRFENYRQPEPETNRVNNYAKLSDAEKEKFDQDMLSLKQTGEKSQKISLEDKTKINTSHFDRYEPDMQMEFKREMRKSIDRAIECKFQTETA